jgi:acyl carrier protein
MKQEDIESRVKTVISKVLDIGVEEISTEANFIFDLGADSMQSLEMIAGFEEEFGIEMDEAAALEVQTVKGAVQFVEKILAAKG